MGQQQQLPPLFNSAPQTQTQPKWELRAQAFPGGSAPLWDKMAGQEPTAGSSSQEHAGQEAVPALLPAGIGGNARAALSEHAPSAQGGKAPAEPASGVDLGPGTLPAP